jgi:hypothetical protein
VKIATPRDELLTALIELGPLFPDWTLGQTLAYLARAAGYADYGAGWCLTDREVLAAAKRLTEVNAERLSQHEIKAISNREDLDRYLEIELGYCGCAHPDEAVELLRDVLRCARDRHESISTLDPMVGCTRAYQDLMARLSFSAVPGLATWFLYLLDSRGFILHGNNVTECSITTKGSQLLDAIEQFWTRSVDDSAQ